ncbi:alpha-hydroxy-acid oxidizing enzyme [Agromyces sp. MMS17-SY077]|uniref:Alpha-hydroxy-acid oxidizing enzyme n=1 Tax=Agromyces seonyuensis TaxID=2662446 RepID=A0A6I4P3P6_9MICO|nr:alpha-hydroxy-acid oxidizing enzyme [Agromyces seonyuensis]
MVQRQFPNPKELAQLMRFKAPTMNPTDRRLEHALTIADLRRIAHRRTPKAAFEYTEGAAEGEISLARARQAFQDIEFHPGILRNVADVDTSREALGGPSAFPFAIAPTGFTRLMQTEGEIAGAGAAGAAGIPFTLSTLGTTSIENVRAANPDGRLWFQLYVMRERERSYELVRRAAAAGFDTLHFTVDTPVAGARLRDKRNGFSIPPQLTPKTVLNAIPRPAWWINFLTTEPLTFASLSSTGGTVGELLDSAMDPTISFDDLEIIRGMWPGKLVVKGVQTLADAKILAGLGVDGIVLSNHGGRQLDRAPVPFELLPEVAREVGGDTEVLVDTGIMSGADIVAAVALGAKSTMVGRAYLYGLMAGGRRGVDKTIEILSNEIVRTMKLLEVRTLDELGPQHVTQLSRFTRVRPAVAAQAEAIAEAKPRTVRAPRTTAAAKPTTARAAKTAAATAAPAKTVAAKSATAKTAARTTASSAPGRTATKSTKPAVAKATAPDAAAPDAD